MRRAFLAFGHGWRHFWRQLRRALANPGIASLTIVGNIALLTCATAFYFVERDANQHVQSFGDALWWAFATMTTVGYGDVVAHTGWGRVISVVLMMTGGVLFLAFIALLGSAFVEVEVLELRSELRELRRLIADRRSEREHAD